jgi:hypothetical protein
MELRVAPKARDAAHPQERQHSAAEGGTRGTERDRPEALSLRRLRRIISGIVTRTGGDAREDHGRSLSEVIALIGRHAPRARPRGRTAKLCRSKHRFNLAARTAARP